MPVPSIPRRLPFESLARRVSLGPLGTLDDAAFNLRHLVGTGVLTPQRPDRLARTLRELARWGASPAAGIATSAITDPDSAAVEDEAGSLTFEELHRRSNALTRGLRDTGVRPGDGVAIMCRNHRGFLEATLACSKLGADEDVADPTLDELIASHDDSTLTEVPEESSRFVILTSGTTGTPKGAQRAQPDTLGPLAALFSRIPLQAREKTVIAAPLFHSWGFAHFLLGLALKSTYVLRRRFDPEETLRAISTSGATALVVVPVMMQRILELPDEVINRYDVRSLRVTAASGSALPGELATEWMHTFGENLYNLYGSTEVAWATIATPEDLRAAPGTAGRPPRGTDRRIHGADGKELPPGETGRIFVGN